MSSYESGAAWAGVSPGGAVLIDQEASLDVVERVWRALGGVSGDPLGAALGVLVETFGVTALPSFALATMAQNGARAVVRGRFDARIVGGAHADEVVQAEGASFWAERHVDEATGIVLRAAGTTGAAVLPLVDGVVRAAAVVIGEAAERPEAPVRPAPTKELPAAEAVPSTPAPMSSASVPPVDAADAPGADGGHAPVAFEPDTEPAVEPSVPPTQEQSIPVVDDAPVAFEPASPSAALGVASGGETLPPNESTFSFTAGPVPADPVTASPLPVEEGTTAYDDLIFGLTRAATVEDAAVRAPEDTPASPSPIGAMPPAGAIAAAPVDAVSLGDHDGLTVSAEQLQALRAQRAGTPAVSLPGASTSEVVLVASTGARAVLDRGAVVGVRPSAVRATGVIPHLIAVPSPSGEISRRHLEIRVEASHILAVDLDSTNGTRLLRVGAEPVRLHPGAATLLVDGDRLDLGDGVELSFEGLR